LTYKIPTKYLLLQEKILQKLKVGAVFSNKNIVYRILEKNTNNLKINTFIRSIRADQSRLA